MALPLKGFVTDEQQFPELYRAGERIERNNIRQDELIKKEDARKSAATTYLTHQLDNKDFLSGTVYDPEINRQLSETLNEGIQLANKGVDTPQIMMALGPKVNKINDYSIKARLVNDQYTKAVELLKNQKGIDPNKFRQGFFETAFYDTDPTTGERKLKDISTIDPNKNWVDETLRTKSVYTPEGIDEFVAKSGKNSRIEDSYVYTNKGGLRRAKLQLDSPSFMRPETDEKGAFTGFVPDYDEASDEDTKVVHGFRQKDGTITNAPVRMVTDEVFKSLPANAKAFLLQEVKGYADKEGVPYNSTQAYHLAKALAYDYLRDSGKNYSKHSELNIEKPDRAPRITIHNNSSSKEPAQIDLREYKDVDGGKDITDLLRGVKVTGLPNGSSLLAESVVYNPSDQTVTYKEYTDKKDATPKKVSLTKFMQDIKTLNPTTDMKFLEGLRKPITGTSTSSQPASNSTYTIKGKKYSLAELKKMGYTEEQVSSYKDK